MNLITPLASGIAGAESGTAQLTKRGTATPATYYDAFEADGATYTSDVSLDANGGATVYVNEVVDVKVYNAFGVLVRKFTAGQDAPAVELKSQSFTGTAYDDGASAAGNPTTVQAALDLVKTSFGTTDFKVSTADGDQNLSDAIAQRGTLIYDVTNVAYGAIGDGATDDSGAVQAAIDAAEAAGSGIVYFPTGTYYCETVLNCTGDLAFVGDGKELSVLKMDFDSGTAHMTLEANTNVRFADLAIEYDASVDFTTQVKLLRLLGSTCSFTRCRIGNATGVGNGGIMIQLEAGDARMAYCEVYLQLDTTGTVERTGVKITGAASQTLKADSCLFDTIGSGAALSSTIAGDSSVTSRVLLSNCRLKGATGGATHYHFHGVRAANIGHFSNCVFEDTAATAVTHFKTTTATALFATAVGCTFDKDATLTDAPLYVRVSEDRYGIDDGNDDTDFSVSVLAYNVYTYGRTSGAAQTLSLADGDALPEGSTFWLEFSAASSCSVTFTQGTGTTLLTFEGPIYALTGNTHKILFVKIDGELKEVLRTANTNVTYTSTDNPIPFDLSRYKCATLESTDATLRTVTFSNATAVPDGTRVFVAVWANHGGTTSVSWANGASSNGVYDAGTSTVATTKRVLFTFTVVGGYVYLTGTGLEVA